MSSRSWFLRQFRLNSFDADSKKRLLATKKFETFKVSGFSMEIRKFNEKKNPAHCTWRLYPPTPSIQIVSKLQIGAYLSRTIANPNSDKTPLSQSLRSVKVLAELLPMGINAIR